MIKKIILILITVTLTSCTAIKEKIPKFEKQVCTDEKPKTLADTFCKKK
tara:strand:- start:123 stop:269 length:147 start_codon:yes stop_codon:yes gene_type:complete